MTQKIKNTFVKKWKVCEVFLSGTKVDWATGSQLFFLKTINLNENQKRFLKKGKYKTLASEAGETDEKEPFNLFNRRTRN